jgi:FdhD protein
VRRTNDSLDEPIRRVAVVRVSGSSDRFEDTVAVEEPLEIQLETSGGERRSVSVTMRTPGNDRELACGFLFTEGIVESAGQIESIRLCGRSEEGSPKENIVRVRLRANVAVDFAKLQRNFYVTSSCGICGKASIDAVRSRGLAAVDSTLRITSGDLLSMVQRASESQSVYSVTGGVHASALFDDRRELFDLAEDVGRHNALDKVIGRAFLAGVLPLDRHVLVLSGRISFELVQKAAAAGIPLIVAVGAPSSLAIELASALDMTLVGFARDSSFNIYCGARRIETGS